MMTRSYRTRLMLGSALALLAMPWATGLAQAQEAGFAIEVAPNTDSYVPFRVGARVFGPAVEPAAGFVRGCRGHVIAEGAGVQLDVTQRMEVLNLTAAGEALQSMVIGTPDGLYRCALADERGYVATALSGAEPGRYRVWLGGDEGAGIDARLFASEQAISAIELFGLDLSRLGEPRGGRHVFAASAETGRQELIRDGVLMASDDLRPLAPEQCWGFGGLDAPDAVMTLEQAGSRFSLFATSERDLVIAVIDPAGRVHCNDDSWQLNPAVTIDSAQAGDYAVFVGGYSPGDGSSFDLYASAGAPAFSNAVIDLDAAPRAGHVALDPGVAAGGQLLATAAIVSNDPVDALPTGLFCAGYTGTDAPDLVMTLDSWQSRLSFYARSEADLVIAVRDPNGQWLCNDDSFGLNPAVSFDDAAAGDYRVWVGTFMQGTPGNYNLYAALGEPAWDASASAAGGQGPDLNALAEPAVARLSFGSDTLIDPRVIFDIAASEIEAFGLGDGCAGFITPSQPDLVIDAAPGLPQLMVYMVSDADGTLVVVGPDGRLHCNDDFEQLNPAVMIPNPQPGAYAVFAGTYAGTGGMATLGVTIATPQWVMDREH